MSKYRQNARGQDCTLRISGYGACSSTETTVLAHAPCRDDGKGFKSPDLWGAFACSKCHDIIDRRVMADANQWEIDEAWLRGIYETQKIQGVFDGRWEKIARQHCTDLEAITLLCEELCRLYFDDWNEDDFYSEMRKLRKLVGMD